MVILAIFYLSYKTYFTQLVDEGSAQRCALLALGRRGGKAVETEKAEVKKRLEKRADSPASSARCVRQPFGGGIVFAI